MQRQPLAAKRTEVLNPHTRRVDLHEARRRRAIGEQHRGFIDRFTASHQSRIAKPKPARFVEIAQIRHGPLPGPARRADGFDQRPV